MAWIPVIDAADAGGELDRAYAGVAPRMRDANIVKIHSLAPETMTAHLGLYKELMFGRSDLSRQERELIAVTVSVANECHY
jgi:alkylhydroperoxidase family enzyme